MQDEVKRAWLAYMRSRGRDNTLLLVVLAGGGREGGWEEILVGEKKRVLDHFFRLLPSID